MQLSSFFEVYTPHLKSTPPPVVSNIGFTAGTPPPPKSTPVTNVGCTWKFQSKKLIMMIIFFFTIIKSPCLYHPDLILLSFIIQDEKNQLLTTNLWLNLVSFPFSKIWRFPGVLTTFFQGWLFITRLSSRGGYITRICSLSRDGYFTGISSRGGYFTRIFSRGGYLSQRVVSDSHIRGIFPPGVVISQEFLLGWLYHKDFFPGVDFFSVHSHKIYPLTWCLFWNWLNKTIIWWWEADILIKLCGWIWWFFICKMYFAWPCESSRNDTHPIPSRL